MKDDEPIEEWKKLPIGGRIIEPGNSKKVDRSNWRLEKPVIDKNKCNGCLLCKIYCPENAISIDKDGKVVIDYNKCKGCGICMNVCPLKAIHMEKNEKD